MEDTNVVVQQLNQLLTGYGYNLYNDANRARADDLLVRQKVSGLLGDSANRLAAIATEYHRDMVPPSTREQPFPSAEIMRPMKQMESLKGRLSTLSSLVRGLPVPTSDRTWLKFRSEKGLLHQLLLLDYELITAAQSINNSVMARSAHSWGLEDGQLVEELLSQLDGQIHLRQSLLQSS